VFRRSRDVPVRIAEEAIANIIKHSGAASARIALAASTAGVRMEIEDAGRGFDPASADASPGMGLLSIRERLRILNGTPHIESAPDHGTRIDAFVPAERRA
jgi:signal transduction histidine kinase